MPEVDIYMYSLSILVHFLGYGILFEYMYICLRCVFCITDCPHRGSTGTVHVKRNGTVELYHMSAGHNTASLNSILYGNTRTVLTGIETVKVHQD